MFFPVLDDPEYDECCGFGGAYLRSGDGGKDHEQRRQHRYIVHWRLLKVTVKKAKGNA